MNRFLTAIVALVSIGGVAGASPILSLQQTGSASAGMTYTLAGKPMALSLDVHLNTDGLRIDGLDFYVTAAAPYASGFSISGGQGPFSASEVQISPTAGVSANAVATTSIFRSAPGDYAGSADYNLMTYAFNLSNLGVGSYTFTPVGTAFVDSPNGVFGAPFGAPAPFTLTITVPEPASLALGGLALGGLLTRRVRRNVSV